jgi:hypothetical protein
MGEGEHALGALARAIGKAHALDTHALRRCLVPGRIEPGVSRYQARSAPPAWPGGLQRTRLTDRSRWVAGHRLHSRSRSDFQPLAAWLLALRAGSPYPVLAIAGEQGSAKTVLSKLLRAVIDPSVAPVRALPRGERNSHRGQQQPRPGLRRSQRPAAWLSGMPSLSSRLLFTDQDEILLAAARPIILNRSCSIEVQTSL